ncbi:MAG: L-aspartate oxidase [Acidobacteria bacterium]|nr:L-aspartate oxidase [Acidobacteriota bacterium]
MRVVDFIVVGGGIAGLRAAIGLADAGRVVVFTKTEASESNTGYAQGGIAVALGDHDSPALHAADTIKAGDGLCDEAAVRVLVEAGPRYVGELIDWGARFARDPAGRLEFGREAAHSVRRVLHAADATGREIGRVLWARVSALSSVETINHGFVTELVVDGGVVDGVRYFDASGEARELRARAVLLATGGAGQVFRETTNPGVATGDGVALAYQAGARVADLEFVQFHPTALAFPGAPRFLISEALRGEGARLVDRAGRPFMTDHDPAGDLAARDIVARGIAREVEAHGGPVYLTLAHLDAAWVRGRFPTIAAMCASLGLDLARDPIPVGPAAHYMMGGVDTDEWGRTSRPGLYAAGEVACTGVHGANRLASNSLLEGLVFGARAATAMRQPPRPAAPKPDRRLIESEAPAPVSAVSLSVDEIRDLMWRSAGLFRDEAGLSAAIAALEAGRTAALAAVEGLACRSSAQWRRLHLLTVAGLVARAARRRRESRGGHYRADYPVRDDRLWRVHVAEQAPAR